MYLSERIALGLKVNGQEVIALGKDAFITEKYKITCCLYDDLGSVVVTPGDDTDNATWDAVMIEVREIRSSAYAC